MSRPLSQPSIAVLYEHPEWFKPMFEEFERRGIQVDEQLAHRHAFDPYERTSPYSLIVNRVSPSAYTRGHGGAIPYTLSYLAYLKDIGANVLNGHEAYTYEFSKARQIGLFRSLGLRHPRSRVINHASMAYGAADGLRYPVIVKPNVGGSGAGIQKFDEPEALREAASSESLQLGIDGTALVQEYLPPRDASIVRVEILNGEFLYGIKLLLESPTSFNLCPADYCKAPNADSDGMTDGVSDRGVPVQSFTPPDEVIEAIKRIMAAANIEVGGVEYLVSDRDGEVYYYDVNALSNFVADAPNVIGFDPFPRLVDYVLARAGVPNGVLEHV